MKPEQVENRLDEEGAAAYREEAERHARALAALRPADFDAVAGEFNRHLDRVQDILLQFARRTSGRVLLGFTYLGHGIVPAAVCCLAF